MNIKETAETLFKELETLKKEQEEVYKNVKKANEYVANYPSIYVETLQNPPEGFKTTENNLKNYTKTQLKESYEVKKNLDSELERINTRISIITNQINLLNFIENE